MHAAGALLAAFLLLASASHSASLQVSPVSLSIGQGQAAEGLWLSNNGEHVVHAQVRVYRWQQPDGQDHLQDTQDIVVSPPYLEIGPGQRQFIRVIRTGDVTGGAGKPASGGAKSGTRNAAADNAGFRKPAAAGAQAAAGTQAAEQAYRLIIDELPVGVAGKGIQFVMRYSVPVFVQPSAQTAPAALQWNIERSGGQSRLVVSNSGAAHAQLADVALRAPSGESVVVRKGLLGYVLPGMTMYWPIPAPLRGAADQYTIEALLNGVATKGIRPARAPSR